MEVKIAWTIRWKSLQLHGKIKMDTSWISRLTEHLALTVPPDHASWGLGDKYVRLASSQFISKGPSGAPWKQERQAEADPGEEHIVTPNTHTKNTGEPVFAAGLGVSVPVLGPFYPELKQWLAAFPHVASLIGPLPGYMGVLHTQPLPVLTAATLFGGCWGTSPKTRVVAS